MSSAFPRRTYPAEKGEMNKLRVVLADDHPIMRKGLRLLVNEQADMEVVGEADNGREAIAVALRLRPDVVVMDVSMPELNGLKATEKLKELCPETKILTLTRHSDDGYLQQLLQAGSSGYVLKQSDPDELVRAIHAVASGQTYLDPAVTETVVGKLSRRAPRGIRHDRKLSGREEEVLRLIAQGYLSKEVAARLQIGIKTVDAHKANGMEKMGMKNRIDLVRYAMLQGWLEDI